METTMLRTWIVGINLDEFNAATAALYEDIQRSRFLQGFSLGINMGALPKSAPEPFVLGFNLGTAARYKTEQARLRDAQNGSKGGPRSWKKNQQPGVEPPVTPPVEPRLNPGVYPNHNPLTGTQNSPLLRSDPKDPNQGGNPSGGTAKPERPAKKPKLADETPEQILGGGKGTPVWEAYWKLVATFGGQAKNPAPKATARMYVNALNAGRTQEQIQSCAQQLRNDIGEVKYMPKLATWLEGGGYLTPDLPKSTGTQTHRSPAHRSAVDQAYLEQIQERMAAAPPRAEMNDAEMDALYGKTS